MTDVGFANCGQLQLLLLSCCSCLCVFSIKNDFSIKSNSCIKKHYDKQQGSTEVQYNTQWAKICLRLLRLLRAVSFSQMDNLRNELDQPACCGGCCNIAPKKTDIRHTQKSYGRPTLLGDSCWMNRAKLSRKAAGGVLLGRNNQNHEHHEQPQGI